MQQLTPDQRNLLYIQEAQRAGIHKPILAALFEVHQQPLLLEGGTGLGVSPANRISLDSLNTFAGQVQYAANTIRSLTNSLTAEGWKGTDFWDISQGRYTDKFLHWIAKGYVAPTNDPTAARLEASPAEMLLEAYSADLAIDYQITVAASKLSDLEPTLITLVEQVDRYYIGLPYQQSALLECVRLWRKLDTRDEAIAVLTDSKLPITANSPPVTTATLDPLTLDLLLVQAIQRLSPHYAGYPHQREALLRLTQLWRQLDSREDAIASLATDRSPAPNLRNIDAALIAWVLRIPQLYQGKGEQRHALVEGYRLWQQLETRSEVLLALGVHPEIFTAAATADQADYIDAATLVDRALLEFMRRVPTIYEGSEQQRQALIHLVQLWQGFAMQEQTLQSLWEDLNRMERARRDAPDAPPAPSPLILPPRPAHWTPNNLQLYASIIPNGHFTWAEATQGGAYVPLNQSTVEAIVRIATLAQQARDRIGRPFHITCWYCASEKQARGRTAAEARYRIGDAIAFYCEGLTGNQLYWFLDPWWPGGLGHYHHFPYLCHLDAREERSRWLH